MSNNLPHQITTTVAAPIVFEHTCLAPDQRAVGDSTDQYGVRLIASPEHPGRVVKRLFHLKNLIFVDCEATGPCPGQGEFTEFGAVEFASRQTFHGVLFESRPKADDPAHSEVTGRALDPVQVFTDFGQWLHSVTSGRCIYVSDNPAYDCQWINYAFHHAIGRNPFGHSGRRISDFYAGLVGDFGNSQDWKRLRVTPHDHNPVNDAVETWKPLHDC